MTYHVLKVRGASEHTVAKRLDAKGIENAVPSEDIVAVRHRRKVTITKPLLSRYVFARGSVAHATATPGVYDVLRHADGVPATISEAAIAALQAPPKPAPARWRRGMRVRLTEGPFKGFDGHITELRKGRAALELTVFGRPTRLEVQLEHLEDA